MFFFVRTSATAIALLHVVALCAMAQTPDSTDRMLPQPDDVASVEAVIGAIYHVISGPETAERDWERFKSLFVPGAHLIATRRNAETGRTEAIIMTPDEYVERARSFFKMPGGFFENEIGRTTEVYGNIAQSFSAYESFREGADEPFMRGINSFQLLNDGERWLIVNVFWEAETPDNPIPSKYLFD